MHIAFFLLLCSFPSICCSNVSFSSSSILFHLHLLEVFRVIGILDSKKRSFSPLHPVQSDWHTAAGVCSMF
ncbi:unnamed protein product [Victoria cruziana]